MKKWMMLGLAAALVVGGTGCMAPKWAGTEYDYGAISSIKYFDSQRQLDNRVDPIKRGTASTRKFLFYLVSVGDASLDTAMQAGEIRQIHHVDTEYMNILGLYQQKTIIVYGD